MTEQLLTVEFEEGRETFLSTIAVANLQKLAKRIIEEDIQNIDVIHGDETQGNAVSKFLYLEGVNTNNISTTYKVGNVVVEIEGQVNEPVEETPAEPDQLPETP